MPVKKKRVVYLFGAGASQAEASFADDKVNLLMSHIKDGILQKIKDANLKGIEEIKNELAGENVDVEQLISLYESSGNKKHRRFSQILKHYFREEIQEQITQLDKAGRFSPKLYSALIDMHEIEKFDERIIGIMTLNYEDLIERAVERIKDGIDYSLEFSVKNNPRIKIIKSGIPLLKLHGSFNWKKEFPVSVTEGLKNDDDILWIPPGVEKETESYPFNVIWGRAKELLDCDILRIIGCSLSRNDWHLVSLLYTTQKLNRSRREYTVEVINRPISDEEETLKIWGEEDIRRKYPHLRIRYVYELKEIRDFVSKSTGAEITKIDDRTVKNFLAKTNVFEIWLRAKAENIKSRNIPTVTPKNIFDDYVREGTR